MPTTGARRSSPAGRTGHRALARRALVHQRFAGQLEAAHRALRADIPEIPEVPPHTFPAAAGAVTEVITAHLIEHGAETLPQLSQAIADIDLTLLMGRELAERLNSG